jgi:hypothetical protein
MQVGGYALRSQLKQRQDNLLLKTKGEILFGNAQALPKLPTARKSLLE